MSLGEEENASNERAPGDEALGLGEGGLVRDEPVPVAKHAPGDEMLASPALDGTAEEEGARDEPDLVEDDESFS